MKFKNLLCLLFLFVLCGQGMAENYIVGPGDFLDIKVYDHPDLSVKIRVTGDGKIRFPLVGELTAQGRGTSEIAEKLEEKLGDGYIINPQVSVSLTEFRSRKATILGEVEKPALYELRGQTTLLELISQAEGLTSEAGRYIYITRTDYPESEDSPEQKIIKIDLKQLIENGDASQNIFIRNGDSIFIPEMKKIYVTGEIKKPSAYRYEEELTVIKTITNAGGLTDKAAPKSVRIIRQVNGEKVVLEKVSMDEKVLPDDVIVIPESFF